MNILIVGCGRVGSELAAALNDEGHTVAVVDANESSFELLPHDFGGFCTAGIPIDMDVLRQAGIENCDALAAVSPDDNTNIMVCQLAREYFKIETLVARINDPRRENVFSHFGLQTICPTRLTVETLRHVLLGEQPQHIMIGSNTVSFQEVPVTRRLFGVPTDSIDVGEEESVFAVRHPNGTLSLVTYKPVILENGDTLIIARTID